MNYVDLGTSIGELVEGKNRAYGDSFGRSGEVLRILYPEGISPEKFSDALTIVRVIDKLFRVANQKRAFDESPWRDIAGYALLALHNDETDDATR